jgi:uncharacterized protein
LTAYFADTSTIVKRYVSEVGSGWVLSWILPASGNITVIAETALVEMFSMLERRHRNRELRRTRVNTLGSNFLIDAE